MVSIFSRLMAVEREAHTQMTSLEQELEQFFADCRRQQFTEKEMGIICKPLIWRWHLQSTLRGLMWILLPAMLVYLLWNYCDSCAWTASAMGRLLLIQLLPHWDWTPLYSNRCLIDSSTPGAEQREQVRSLGRHETQWENCALCETLGKSCVVGIFNPLQLELSLSVLLTQRAYQPLRM